MESIQVRQHVGQDGILHLDIPVRLPHQEVEAVVIYQPVQSLRTTKPSLASRYGICADDSMVVDDCGISESLDDELTGAFD